MIIALTGFPLDWFVARMSAEVRWLPHAHPIEVAQLLMSCIGCAYSLRGTREAWTDLRFVKAVGLNGARDFVARRNVYEETVRLTIHALFVVSGTVLIFYPSSDPGVVTHADRYAHGMVMRWVMLLTSLLLTLKSHRDIQDRRHLREILETQLVDSEPRGGEKEESRG